MTNKPCHKPNKAIKHPFKFLLLGVFVIFGLLLTNEAIFGIENLEENFEDYNLGYLNEQGNWVQYGAYNSMWVVSDKSNTGYQSIFNSQQTGDYAISQITASSSESGSLSAYFYVPSDNRLSEPRYSFLWLATSTTPKVFIHFYYESDDTIDVKIRDFTQSPFPYTTIATDLTCDEWHKAQVDWASSTNSVTITLDGTPYDPVELLAPFYPIKTLFVGSWITGYFDDLNVKVCDVENCNLCETWLTCENAGCFWYYSFLLGRNFCGDVNPELCGSSVVACPNCLTQETCLAETWCYWFNGACKFGTGACGEGLELQFCENQGDCETAGGYWYEDFCWLSAPVSLTSWGDYYDEYGDYATPSAWISNMASTTSIFLGQMGGFLTIFETNFDLMEAFERGQNFGVVIPQARGYLAIFNNFLGGFPIGEFFVFLLVFMLAVGVFRIMRNLFQLIKFW